MPSDYICTYDQCDGRGDDTSEAGDSGQEICNGVRHGGDRNC